MFNVACFGTSRC